jgi:hypothetical protein
MDWGETTAYEANGVPSANAREKTIYFTPVVDDGVGRTACEKDARKVRECREESAGRTIRSQPMHVRNNLYGQASGRAFGQTEVGLDKDFCQWRNSSDSWRHWE